MLVLSRKEGEAVCIGDGIQIKVLGIRSGKVRLGFTAPKTVRIVRDNARQKSAETDGDRQAQSWPEQNGPLAPMPDRPDRAAFGSDATVAENGELTAERAMR